jgi:hypothetical protein
VFNSCNPNLAQRSTKQFLIFEVFHTSSFLSNVVQVVILCAVGYPASFELMQFRAFATVDGHFDWDVKSVLQVPSKFPSSCNVRCSLVKTRVPVC